MVYTLILFIQNAVCFIILTYLGPVLFTFYIQGVLKFKKIIPAPEGLYTELREVLVLARVRPETWKISTLIASYLVRW
jgi:hypothetical protein